jgi:hypothetical protein
MRESFASMRMLSFGMGRERQQDGSRKQQVASRRGNKEMGNSGATAAHGCG